LISSTRLPCSSVTQALSPVMLPPGRASWATTPGPIGSPIAAITIGMLWVAFFAASAAGVPLVTMRSTPAATSSAAISGNLAASPSADLYSM